MGQITLSSQRSTDPQPMTYVVEIADGDLDRIIMAWAPVLFPPAGTDADGAPVTGDMVFQRMTERTVDQIKVESENLLRGQAAAEASAAVPPIIVTPV